MASGGTVAYLRVEKPRFLFLGGSAGVVAAADVATAAPPVNSAACAGASAARVTSLVGCLVAGAHAPSPGAVSSAASAALGEGGEGSHLSGRVRPPSLSSSSPDDESSEVAGGESPCCSGSRNSSSRCSRCSRRRILFSFLRAARSCSHRCAARARARARGVGGSDRVASTTITYKGRVKLRVTTTHRGSIERRGAGIHSPTGRRGA
jgi:hypothetical protein